MRPHKIEMVSLERNEFRAIYPEPIREVKLNYRREETMEAIIHELSTTIFGREISIIEHKYPKDWWQHFKQRWFPKWARKKWPVEMIYVRMTAREFYPQISLPEKQHFIRICKDVEPFTAYHPHDT